MTEPVLHHLHTARCIIFDFDGVIVESEAIKEAGFHHVFRRNPQAAAAVAPYLLKFPGQTRSHRIAGIWRTVYDSAPPESVLAAFVKDFGDYVLHRVLACPEVPGARAFLEARSREIPLFLSSATPQDELQLICKQRQLSSFFQAIYGAPEHKVSHISRILGDIQLEPAECLFIGDSPSDLSAAQACGVPFLARQSTVNIDHLDCPKIADFRI